MQPDRIGAAAANAANGPQPVLTRTEVSTWLGVPVKTLATWRGRGYGPRFLRCGVHVRYRASEVEKWLELQERDISSQST